MEEKVLEIVKRVFGLDAIDFSSSQSTCEKWDSISHLDLVIELETEFGVSFEPEEIGEMKSVADIIRILKNK